ncbi:MAG TPA: hypothetical protein PL028_08435, partial [Bacteroidales bacterium]|nr:hypothetical protein [Bacteroidales bacterium]
KGVIEPSEVISEIIQMLPEPNNTKKYSFAETTDENRCRLFDYGCDALVKYFEDKYVELLNNEKNS